MPVGVPAAFKATSPWTASPPREASPTAGSPTQRWLSGQAGRRGAGCPRHLPNSPAGPRSGVEVLEQRDGRLATVAKSPDLELTSPSPGWGLSFDPSGPFVGQVVTARLTVTPEVKEIDFRWTRRRATSSRSAKLRRPIDQVLLLKDDKPAGIEVKARVPRSGGGPGAASGSVQAKKYAVTVTGPKVSGPKPRVWKDGVGLVEMENAIAVDQIVEFTAAVQPGAGKAAP